MNASLITGLDPWGITTDGTNLFVENFDSGVVGEYSTSGAAINADLFTVPFASYDIAYLDTGSGIPEPGTIGLLGLGMVGIGLLTPKRRRQTWALSIRTLRRRRL